MTFLSRWFQALLPAHHHAGPTRRRAEVLLGMLVICLGLELTVIVSDLAYGSPALWISPAIIGTVLLPSYVALWLSRGTAWATNLFVGSLNLASMTVIVAQGGIASDASVVLVLLPLVAMLVGSRRSGLLWGGTNLVFIVVIATLGPLPRVLPDTSTEHFMPLLVTLVTSVVLVFLTDRGRDRAEAELREARAAAEAATAARTDFLAMMSHEVRTPLYGILGSAELLADAELDEEDRRHVQTIRTSGSGLLSLLGDILDLTKLDAAKLELEEAPVSLRCLVETVADAIRPLTQEDVEVRTEVGTDHGAIGDENRLRQILLNLAVNAARFTEQGTIVLRVRQEGDDVVLEVEDTGIGMTEEQSRRLFEPFEQADASTSRRHGGTGLGLTIAASLSRAMGGELVVRSTPGQGSRFTARLPLPPASLTPDDDEEAAPPAPARDPAGADELRILLAEDHPVNRRLLTAMLTSLGVGDLRVADDGASVVRLFTEDADVDILLMDIEMPGMDGLEAARRIRALPGGGEPTILALTAHAVSEKRDEAVRAGMDGFLTKPITRDRLAEMLAEHGRHGGRAA